MNDGARPAIDPPAPATDAGIQMGDIITSIDETPASGLTMFRINELFDVNIIGLIKITQLAARLMS